MGDAGIGVSEAGEFYLMKVAIPKERRAGELRVAASPETVKKLKGLGLDVVVEHHRRGL